MAKLAEKLTSLLNPPVAALGFELLGIEFIRAGKHSTLRVYIDHPDGINVDQCADVSYQISGVLDIEDPIQSEYNLEVSSPGLDRPLFNEQHYQRVIGEMAAIRLRVPQGNRRNFKGIITAVCAGMVTIDIDGEHFNLPIEQIEKGNLVPNFT